MRVERMDLEGPGGIELVGLMVDREARSAVRTEAEVEVEVVMVDHVRDNNGCLFSAIIAGAV